MRRLCFFLRLLPRAACDVAKGGAWCGFVALAILGLWLGAMVIVEAYSNPRLPPVRPIPAGVQWQYRPAPTRAEVLAMSAGERWGRMAGALWMLDRVCPEIADWTREHRRCHRIVFMDEAPGDNRLADYNMAARVLRIYPGGLAQSDAGIAVTLAHEFRHSRQGLLRCLVWSVALALGTDGSWILEPEAYAFQREVSKALRGER